MTTYEATAWKQLLAFLDTLGHVEEIALGRIAISPRGKTRRFEILMTVEQWVEMISIPWGNFEDAAEDVRRSILSAADHELFLVYADYRLEPSPAAHLARGRGQERLDHLLRESDGKPIGSWVAHDDESHPTTSLTSLTSRPARCIFGLASVPIW